MPIKCPYCTNSIELEIIVNPKSQETLFITRKEYVEEGLKLEDEKQYIILGYDSNKDKFRVVKRK